MNRVSFASAFLILSALMALAATGNQQDENVIEKVYATPDGQVHLVRRGVDKIAPKEKDQASCASPKLSEDRRTAGWLVNFDNPDNSYPIPLSLVIYRDNQVIQRFAPGQSIWDWQFLGNGTKVAFWIGPTHGDFVPHFELHSVLTGRLLAQWDGHLDRRHPNWVDGLKE